MTRGVDPALDLMLTQLRPDAGQCLAIADEHLIDSAPFPVRPGLRYLSNRFDVAAALQQRGADCAFNDFDFSSYPVGSLQRVIYRISKEKSLVHHIINGAGRTLAAGGELVLIGHKNEGLVTYCKKASKLLGGVAQRGRRDRGYSAVSIARTGTTGPALDDDRYASLRAAVTGAQGIQFYSKPGIYGWQKIDRGSQLLIDSLASGLERDRPAHPWSVLDLGCGYGFLSVMASRLLVSSEFTATDNNIAAIAACQRNFAEHGVRGQVIADDCAGGITRRFDLVLCNPPFHRGFDTSKSITAHFLRQTARHLKSDGAAWFVVNRFIDIETPATTLFSQCREVAGTGGFRILRLAP